MQDKSSARLAHKMDFWPLYIAAFGAGFIDAIAGGGGLIQLPALLLFRPDLSLVTILASNKLSSICGTSAAIARYSRSVVLPWKDLAWAGAVALMASAVGAWTVSHIPSGFLKPLVVLMLILIFVYTVLAPRFKRERTQWARGKSRLPLIVLASAAIGFYDGFFGPGTGSFIIFFFVALLGYEFLKASASAKIINWGTNVGALIYFGAQGSIDYKLGLSLGAFNLLGGLAGSHSAIKRGAGFVRKVFLLMVAALLVKLILDLGAVK